METIKFYRNISLLNLMIFGDRKFPLFELKIIVPGDSFDLFFISSVICLYETILDGKSTYKNCNELNLPNNKLIIKEIKTIWKNNSEYVYKSEDIFEEKKYVYDFLINYINYRKDYIF